ncbi:uncharacterized protein BDZ83DRAFT_730485 [Colletotrichum acutatum]|uniref:Uncharacterized protein n=1 Tax=Glomerella acutata TaxID=27357 RepID=A0AAD8UQK9_GLOAC|nr:uncharacterized protein BDZ83DRAFT_730485 [Colletotrichum acutatum]KAK1725409.1 hypothetical protein BDZ83DRAFT_730485 [Colletotrichum acutatum]
MVEAKDNDELDGNTGSENYTSEEKRQGERHLIFYDPCICVNRIPLPSGSAFGKRGLQDLAQANTFLHPFLGGPHGELISGEWAIKRGGSATRLSKMPRVCCNGIQMPTTSGNKVEEVSDTNRQSGDSTDVWDATFSTRGKRQLIIGLTRFLQTAMALQRPMYVSRPSTERNGTPVGVHSQMVVPFTAAQKPRRTRQDPKVPELKFKWSPEGLWNPILNHNGSTNGLFWA